VGEIARRDTLPDASRNERGSERRRGDLSGQVLPGDYVLIEPIREGGMGRVYRAWQRSLGREVAVKVLHRHLCADQTSRERFALEARVASRFSHPNAVELLDYGQSAAGQPYIVMELVRGVDLARLRREQGPLDLGRVLELIGQVLSALSEAHAQGIVHRDLKPENVIVRPLAHGRELVKVIDFGIALGPAGSPRNVTAPGILCGTPAYVAPEQLRGEPLDGRCDLYAVGVMLFELVTGCLPFSADDPCIPEPLLRVLQKALAKPVAERYQDALDLHDDLLLALAAAEAPSPGWSEREVEFMGCAGCASCVPIARHCCDCGRPLVLSSLVVPPRPALAHHALAS
jgi:serine/threonine protein kinase